MIKYSQDIHVETVENSGNIEGRISKNIVLTPAEMLERASMFNIITLPSGSRIKEHPHIEDAEIYYILEGEAEVTDNDKTAVMRAGDVMFTGNGARHSIANYSGKDVKFLACILRM
jgi:mannose-6-phosphate isomerase-like protein (cupin superfamily)